MSLIQTLVYDAAGNFTFDSTKIQITSGHAQLKLIDLPSQVFTQDYSSSSGFSFNSSYTEFTGGVMRQKAHSIGPTFTHFVNTISPSSGVVTKNTGGPGYNSSAMSVETITGNGLIQFTANAASAPVIGLSTNSNVNADYTQINYAIDLNGGQIFIIESGVQVAPSIVPYVSGDILKIVITGTTVTYLKNGTVFYTSLTPATLPLYFATVINLQGDSVIGILLQNSATNYLADLIVLPTFTYGGIGNVVSFDTAIITDTNSPGYVLNGRYWNGSMWTSSNLSYAQTSTAAQVIANISTLPPANTLVVQVITTSQSSTQMSCDLFTVDYSGQIYPTSNPTIINNSGIEVDGLVNFLETTTIVGSDGIKYTLNVNAQDKYWNGAAWVNSNGTYAQSNTAADIATNMPSLSLTGGALLKIKAFLHSNDGSTSPQLTQVSVYYDFFVIPPAEPTKCVVYAFTNDMMGVLGPSESLILTVSLSKTLHYGNRMITPFTRIFNFNADGYVETTPSYLATADASCTDGLVETQSINQSPYTFTLSWLDSTGSPVTFSTSGVQVPNAVEANLADLMTFT